MFVIQIITMYVLISASVGLGIYFAHQANKPPFSFAYIFGIVCCILFALFAPGLVFGFR